MDKSEGTINITTQKPGIKSFEDYDVQFGKSGLSRDEYKAATFHNSSEEGGDARFEEKAKLLETTGAALFEQSEKLETNVEKKMEAGGEKN